MLKTRRQIRTEEDRFGGYYSSTPSYDTEKNRFDSARESRTYFTDVPETSSSLGAERSAPVRYSQRETEYPATAVEYVGETYKASMPARTVRRDPESMMPSVKTRRAIERDEQEEAKVQPKSSMSSKNKIMLGIYAVVVVILAAIVIATGIAIGNMDTTVESLQDEISYRNEVLTQQNAELAALDNAYTITGHATELGMTEPDSFVQVEMLPMSETVTYEARTNWFDKFCDWLSKLIGG